MPARLCHSACAAIGALIFRTLRGETYCRCPERVSLGVRTEGTGKCLFESRASAGNSSLVDKVNQPDSWAPQLNSIQLMSCLEKPRIERHGHTALESRRAYAYIYCASRDQTWRGVDYPPRLPRLLAVPPVRRLFAIRSHHHLPRLQEAPTQPNVTFWGLDHDLSAQSPLHAALQPDCRGSATRR